MLHALRRQPYMIATAYGPTTQTSQRDSQGKNIVREDSAHSGVIGSMRQSDNKNRGYNHPSSVPHRKDEEKDEKGQMSKEKERRLIKEMVEKELFDTPEGPVETESESESEDN